MPELPEYPRLRRVEAFPAADSPDGVPLYVVRDVTGLVPQLIALPEPAMRILALMDGEHTLVDIQVIFGQRTGHIIPRKQLEEMVRQLDEAHFLDSPAFAAYFQSLVDAYQAAPARVSAGEESFGVEPGQLGMVIDKMLADGQYRPPKANRRLAGLIAPHLDYPRGGPAYAKAYRCLASAELPHRVIVLGTNHFGQASSPVATRKDFQTPLGTTRTDRSFIDALADRLGVQLCQDEFDHQREHSVELQVLILQQILGPERFELVPVLCPDVCGPSGTAPCDGKGADVRAFGEQLGELIRAERVPTLVVAGADLSHVGWQFGDERNLDARFLQEVEEKDREALDALVEKGQDAFAEVIKSRENDTRICSAGCIYALMTALPGAKPELLGYHQAANPDAGNGVTCAAVALWAE